MSKLKVTKTTMNGVPVRVVILDKEKNGRN